MTGDDLTQALLPALTDLIMAVHTHDRDAVAEAFNAASAVTGDPLAAATHLAVLGAALGRPDLTLRVQLGWTVLDPMGALNA
jgi:2-keto-4-pentenoate hydratase